MVAQDEAPAVAVHWLGLGRRLEILLVGGAAIEQGADRVALGDRGLTFGLARTGGIEFGQQVVPALVEPVDRR
nr:hypothetical protein [Rhodococcus sp. MTM3W5.2]